MTGEIYEVEKPVEYDSFRDFIEHNHLIEEFEKLEKKDFDNCNFDELIQDYGSDVDAIKEYIKRFWQGKWYVGWGIMNDEIIEVAGVYKD